MARGKRVATVFLAIGAGFILLLGAWTALAGVDDGDYTNYLNNGSFDNGLAYWIPSHASAFSHVTSCPDGHTGCLVMESNPSPSTFWIEQDVSIGVTGTVQLSGDFRFWPSDFVSGEILTQLLDPSGSEVLSITCGFGDSCETSWDTLTAGGTITASGIHTLKITGNWGNCGLFCPNEDSYVDNLVLTVNGEGPPQENALLERMVWGAGPECPVCSVQNAVGWAGGPINTRNGNLSYQETDLSIPVQGGALALRRSYASQAVDVYTTTMGRGWTHNYDMRLHFTGNALTDTVELQAPGGSRLPFFDNGDGTYTPYAGVTAQLAEVGATYVVTAFNQMVYTFDAGGLLQQQEDASGNVITFTHNAQGQLTEAAQGSRSLTYAYEAGTGYLDSVTDNAGRSVELGYDGNGDLAVVTDTLGLTTTYQYSGTTHLLTEVIDPAGVTVEETAYDAQGRAVRQWDGAGNLLVDVDFTITNTHVVTENGVVMTHTYDSRGTLVDSAFSCAEGTAGCGSGTDKSYDFNFKANQTVDANGNATDLSWDPGGSNLEQVTDALNNSTNMAYDTLNNLTQVVNARGLTTTYAYDNANLPTFRTGMTDALGNTTIYTPTVDGLLAAEQDAKGRVTTYSYNSFGQTTQVVQAAGTSEAVTTTYGYDAVGRLQTTTESSATESHTTLNVYDDGDRLVTTIANWTGSNPANWASFCDTSAGPRDENVCTQYGYDEAGRTISTTNTLGQTDLTFYDAAGRTVAAVGNWDGSAYTSYNDLCNFTSPDPEHNVCTLTGYDQAGRVVSTTNPLGHVARTFYDGLGRVAGTVQNSVNVTALAQCAFPPASPDQDLCTTYEYDAAGNTIVVKDPLGRETRTFYDELNRVEATVENWSGSITDPAQCAFPPSQPDADLCTLYEFDQVGNTTLVTDTLGHQTRTFYDELNRVEGTVQNWQAGFVLADCFDPGLDPQRDENVCTLYEYDEAGNQTVVTNAKEQKQLTVYDGANRPVVQVQNWDGATVIEADGTGCADTATNPNAEENLCTFTAYDALGRRASATDVLGNVTEFAYDGLGRVVTTTRTLDQSPISTLQSYDALGNRLSETDANGHTTNYSYDGLNRLATTTSHEGVATTQTYNAAGWVLSTTDGLNHTTTNSYDDLGRLLSTTDPENNTTQYEYDAAGNQTAMIDAEGVKTSYNYDALDRLAGVTENDTGGAQTEESNLLTQYAYDALGQRTAITNARGVSVTHTLYDGLNRPVQMQDALGNATQYSYDLLGNRAVITDANGEVTQHSYDALNRLITTTYAADSVTVGYQYDAAGNRTQMVDDVGTTTYVYDDFYRLITVTNPITGSVGYRYDEAGNRTGLIYPDGRSVDYSFDGDNRLLQVDDWNNGATTYGYDGAGRLITTTLPNGVVSTNAYDDANRLLSLRHEAADGSLLAEYLYQLDGAGNRVAVTETVRAPDVVQTIEAYQEQNGLLVVEAENGTATASAGHDWQTQTAQSGYEGTGYSRALPDIGARYEETETASSPQLSWPIYNETGDTYSVWVRGMAPDAAGDSLHMSVDSATPSTAADLTGFTSEWSWSRATMAGGNATLDLTTAGEHTLDAWMREDGLRVDRALLVTDTNYIPSGLGPAESSFQTITETVPGGLGTTSIAYQYDALYRLTDAAYTGAITATFVYDYDSVGNMTAFTETVDAQTTSASRSFDGANRLEYAVDASGTTTYTYDANGNLIELLPPGATGSNPVGALRYDYDQRNLMVSHETNPDGTAWVLQAEYVYDGADDRLQQIDYTGATPITTTYTNDIFGLTQVLVAADGTNQVYNLFGLDLISQDGDEVRTLLVDGLGSVRLEMVGSVVETATTYTPYGELLEQAGTSGTAYGFTGEQEDGATGLLYLRARYYNSELKTFMGRDPWEGTGRRPGTLNYYAYVHANPVNYTDPTGWARIKVWASAFLEPATLNFPPGWVTAPAFFSEAVWEGDGRTFYKGGPRPSARVWHEVIIDTDRINDQCRPYELSPNYIISNQAGTGSTKVDIYIGASTIPLTLVGKAPAPTKASIHTIPSERTFVVTLKAHSPNPVTDKLGIDTPPIDYWYVLLIDLETAEFTVAGYHDEYPWHELYFEVNGKRQKPLVQAPPSGTTKTPLDLGEPFFDDSVPVYRYRIIPALRD